MPGHRHARVAGAATPPPVGLVHPWCARNEDLDASLRGRRSRWAPVPLHQRERPKVQSVSGGRPPRWLVSTSVSEVSALRETCNRALVPGRWGACPDPRDQDQAHRAGGSWPELTTDANVQPIHGALLSTCGDAGRDDAPDSKGARSRALFRGGGCGARRPPAPAKGGWGADGGTTVGQLRDAIPRHPICRHLGAIAAARPRRDTWFRRPDLSYP
jgi:hypothetical protein